MIKNITVGIAVRDVKKATQWHKTLLGHVKKMEPVPGTVELQLTEKKMCGIQTDPRRNGTNL